MTSTRFVRPLLALLTLSAACDGAPPIDAQQSAICAPEPDFAWWCKNATGEDRITVEQLVKNSGAASCEEAAPRLSELTELRLAYGYRIKSVAPLASLSRLESLSLVWQQVSDPAPLTRLPRLRTLTIATPADDFALARLAGARLEALSISDDKTDADDVAALLPKLPRLRDLNVGRSELRRESLTLLLQAVASQRLHKLALGTYRPLTLDGQPLTDVTPFASLQSLRRLQLRGSSVVDLRPLAGLRHLGGLDLASHQVPLDATLLATLPRHLHELSLASTRLTSSEALAPLSALTCLEVLDLSWVALQNIDALAPLTGLRGFDLSSTGIADLTPLRDMARLEKLRAINGHINNLAPLANKPALKMLDLDWNEIPGNEVAQLAASRKLEMLTLGSNYFSDEHMALLLPFTELRTLNLFNDDREHRISHSLQHLAGMTHLETLDLDSNFIDDEGIANLPSLPALRQLKIQMNPFTSAAIPQMPELPALAELYVSSHLDRQALQARYPHALIPQTF